MALKGEPSRLRVHEAAAEVASDCVHLARTFRGPGAFARGDQLVRAALSVPSNIAEACGRGTVAEFRQFLVYARGSAHETLSQLRIARRLDAEQGPGIRRLENRVVVILKMLGRLIERPPPER